MTELMSRAHKHMNAEDAMRARRDAKAVSSRKRLNDHSDGRGTKVPRGPGFRERGTKQIDRRTRTFAEFTPLNSRMEQVFHTIKDDPEFRWPREMRAPPEARNQNKYCLYHRDHGHDTEECYDLKRLVDELIRKSRYNGFIDGQKEDMRADRRSPPRREDQIQAPNRDRDIQRPLGEIRVIAGGFPGGEETSSRRKRYAKELNKTGEIMTLSQLTKKVKEAAPIVFTNGEVPDVCHPHDDPLVISAIIANFQIWRILIDSGSSADILFWKAFEKMEIGKEKL